MTRLEVYHVRLVHRRREARDAHGIAADGLDQRLQIRQHRHNIHDPAPRGRGGGEDDQERAHHAARPGGERAASARGRARPPVRASAGPSGCRRARPSARPRCRIVIRPRVAWRPARLRFSVLEAERPRSNSSDSTRRMRNASMASPASFRPVLPLGQPTDRLHQRDVLVHGEDPSGSASMYDFLRCRGGGTAPRSPTSSLVGQPHSGEDDHGVPRGCRREIVRRPGHARHLLIGGLPSPCPSVHDELVKEMRLQR